MSTHLPFSIFVDLWLRLSGELQRGVQALPQIGHLLQSHGDPDQIARDATANRRHPRYRREIQSPFSPHWMKRFLGAGVSTPPCCKRGCRGFVGPVPQPLWMRSLFFLSEHRAPAKEISREKKCSAESRSPAISPPAAPRSALRSPPRFPGRPGAP
jgi:hypothetical protein